MKKNLQIERNLFIKRCQIILINGIIIIIKKKKISVRLANVKKL